MSHHERTRAPVLALAFWSAWDSLALGCAEPEVRASAPEVVVPRLWTAEALEGWATPVAGLGVPPSFVSEEEYYAAPIDNLRTYPVYHPRSEPPGYREWIRAQGPQRLIEPEKLHSRADWIEAGRNVFEGLDTPVFRISDPAVFAYLSDPEAIDNTGEEVTKDGVIPFFRWLVDVDGSLKVSAQSCAGCHARMMPDGSVLYGAFGSPEVDDSTPSPAFEAMLAQEEGYTSGSPTAGELFFSWFGVPWVEGDVHARFKTLSDAEVDAFWSENEIDIAGTFARINGSPYFTTRVADLRGVKHRKYLDATGTHKNRGPEDIARYGILVEYADHWVFGPHELKPPERRSIPLRPPDEAMYAMALYLYSLEPPPSPHPFDAAAARGQAIFEAEGCSECHTPPDYTNNKLVAVPGFEPPADDPATQWLDVSTRRVGTDPGLALQTRKGTGYYKIPSLRGLWYRDLLEHCGSVRFLEDWFDPRRLGDDYVPTGCKGPGAEHRAVPGHEFGLDLTDEEKRELIAFLRTL